MISKYEKDYKSFVSMLTDGIKNPFSSFLKFSKLKISKETTNIKHERYQQRIQSKKNILVQFIENLIELSQIETKKSNLIVSKCNLNKIIWEYTEELYSFNSENNNIRLILNWESKDQELNIITNESLVKKSIQKMVDIVTKKYLINEYELGYRKNKEKIEIFIKPVFRGKDIVNQHTRALIKNNSFDSLNHKILKECIEQLKGNLHINPEKHEYIFSIPLNILT